eukprot:5042682-Ditylum_brightwellii.AAC.1
MVRFRTQAYLHATICNEPFIYGQDGSIKKKSDNNNSPFHVFKTSNDENSDLRGNLSICGLWQTQTDSIIDI